VEDGGGGRGERGTKVTPQIKCLPFVSCQLNFGPYVS